jgi:CheY-like chemotaxis protein
LLPDAAEINISEVMAHSSLLVCADAQCVQTLSRILLNMGMNVNYCGDPSSAIARCLSQRFDTVLVDCEQEDAAKFLIEQLRIDSANKDVVVIAILDGRNNAREIFAKGANFVLYKPISSDRLNKSMAAAKIMIHTERRLTRRVPVDANASIAYASTENQITRVIDLSEDGMSIYSPKPLPRDCKVYFQFSLPGESSTVRLSCEVIWQNDSGNVGMRFVDVPKASRRILDYWIQNKVGSQLRLVASPDTTAAPSNSFRQGLVEQLGLVAASSPERRQEQRHQCSLGAEVARAGSAISQRCVISDVSAGGCYVQTSEPLPAGTAVEIVLRTQELKLRLRGKVQSVHRGLGMGVHFSGNRVSDDLQRVISELQKQPAPV